MEEINLDALKAQHGTITTVTIPLNDGGETMTIHCKAPTRQIRRMIFEMQEKNEDAAIIAGYNALKVAGDEVKLLENNDYAMTSAEDALISLLQVKKAEIKKN